MVRVVGERRLEVDVAQQLVVALGDCAPRLEDAVELLELPDPERGRDVVEAVVVTEPPVLQPARRLEAPWLRSDSSSCVLSALPVVTAPPSPVVICLFG